MLFENFDGGLHDDEGSDVYRRIAKTPKEIVMKRVATTVLLLIPLLYTAAGTGSWAFIVGPTVTSPILIGPAIAALVVVEGVTGTEVGASVEVDV